MPARPSYESSEEEEEEEEEELTEPDNPFYWSLLITCYASILLPPCAI
jgi:hypothetical protein